MFPYYNKLVYPLADVDLAAQGTACRYRRPSNFFERYASWVILAAGWGVRLAQILASRPHTGRDLTEMELVARSLALHGSFADPYLHPSGPTAHVAPGVPALLAAVYLLFGIGFWGQTVTRALAALAASIQYALLPRVASALRIPRRFGITAGLLAALIPYKSFAETTESPWEQAYVALALILLFLHTEKQWSHPLDSVRAAIVRGVYWGVATLISPLIGVVFVAVLGYEAVVWRRTGRVATALAVFVLLQVPWTVRNWIELRGFVPSRSNFGIEFSVSNGPTSHALTEDNVSAGVLAHVHPSHDENEWRRLRELGEVAYNRERLRATLAGVERNPARFGRLTFDRVWMFWLLPSRRWRTTLATTVVFLIGVWGLWRMPRSHGKTLIWLILAVYPLVYYLIEIDRRYRYPIEWIFIVPAVWAVAWWREAFVRGRRRAATP
jgi:hypothetical protein